MKKILVVDDEERIQRLLMDELGDEGHEITTASNGIESLSLLNDGRTQPDLIILDLRMPLMDGLETMGRLLKSRINIPVIIYSAFRGYKEDVMAMAASAYVVKSHDLKELKQTVKRCLKVAHGNQSSMIHCRRSREHSCSAYRCSIRWKSGGRAILPGLSICWLPLELPLPSLSCSIMVQDSEKKNL